MIFLSTIFNCMYKIKLWGETHIFGNIALKPSNQFSKIKQWIRSRKSELFNQLKQMSEILFHSTLKYMVEIFLCKVAESLLQTRMVNNQGNTSK